MGVSAGPRAEEAASDRPSAATDDSGIAWKLSLYGDAMLDTGYEFLVSDPQWFDVARPTTLPSTTGQFGDDGHYFSGVRQSRFGLKGSAPTALGDINTMFEFDLFGTGDQAGQTALTIQHAWGELGPVGAGQTWSVFMDPDVFPNTIEYWGPNGMVFFRNVQLRFTQVSTKSLEAMLAFERPGASGDRGNYAERIQLQNVRGRFPLPDITAHVRWHGDLGDAQLAGILRYIEWDDELLSRGVNLSGHAFGWGVNATANIDVMKDVVHLEAVFGSAIESYLNDADVDIGVHRTPADHATPIHGVGLPVLGLVAFYDHTWAEWITSSVGWSMVEVCNSDGQPRSAFQAGQYATGNLLFKPVSNVLVGPELEWVWRRNKSDGFTANDFRIRFSLQWGFDVDLDGRK